MTRGNFFKSMAALFATPNAIIQISSELAATNVAASIQLSNKNLIQDLQLLMPHFYEKYVDKYGDDSYLMFLELLNKQ